MGKKNFQQRMRKNNTTTANAKSKTQTMKKNDISVSSCSSSETEEEDEIEEVYNNHLQDFNTINKKSSLIVNAAPSIKSLQASQIKVALKTSVVLADEDDKQLENEVVQVVVATPANDLKVHYMDNNDSIIVTKAIIIENINELYCIIIFNEKCSCSE